MRLLNRKTRLQRVLGTIGDSLDVPSAIKSGIPSAGSGRVPKVPLPKLPALKADVPRDKAVRAGVVAGGLVGLTAGSAGISAVRRRTEEARDDS
jgi:hypothetical protein